MVRSRGYINYKALIARHIFTDVFKGDDGYWIFWPQSNVGAYTAADLEMIALLLNEANRLWDKEISEYFASQKESDQLNPHIIGEADTEWGRLPIIEL